MKRHSSIDLLALVACAALAAGSHAADVSSYGVAKAHLFIQSSSAAPVEQPGAPYALAVWVEGDIDAITGATVQSPLGFPLDLDLNDAGTRFEAVAPVTAETLDFLAPNGTYSFNIESDNDLISLAQLSLSGSAFPATIPQISNFDAAQEIDAGAAFTLNWNTQSDAPAFRLVIVDDSGAEVIVEEGSAAGFTIPAGTLAADSSYVGRLRFRKLLGSDTASIPGAIGTAELYNETEFEISTGAGGGGPGGDTTPPVLFLTAPANGATGIAPSAPVSFIFSEPMQAAQSIQWSANVNAGALNYAWSNGGKTLTATLAGGFPANATITWSLNSAAFKDVAGNALVAFNLSGSFTTGTGGGPADPCNGSGGFDGRGSGSVSKLAFYEQTGNNNPVPSAEMPAAFFASYAAASNHTVTAVSIMGPVNRTLQKNILGQFFFSEEAQTAAGLDAAFPAGNYTLNATGAGSATVALGGVAQVPVPKVNNLVELGNMNPANAFTLTFAPFTGAGASDGISISITREGGSNVFSAPDFCKNILLPNTATSVVIPANTFQAGGKYVGSITFSKSVFNTNSIAGTTVTGGVSASTEFGFTAPSGTTGTQPRWTSIRRNANGTISFFLTAEAGANLLIEGSDLSGAWLQAGAGLATGGTFEFIVDPRLQPRRLFRAKAL